MTMFRRRWSAPYPDVSGGGGSPPPPAVELVLVNGQWYYDDGGGVAADGYMTSADGKSFLIDDAATGGLDLSITNGRPYISYP